MYEVDARGLSCPEPLMMANEAIQKHAGEQIKVLVSEATPKANIEKLAKSKGKKVTVREVGQDFELVIE